VQAAEPQSPVSAPHTVPGWYLGMPVLLNARPPAHADRNKLPQFPVYITAPVSATAGAAPTRNVKRPDGRMVVLPPHQDTLAELNSAAAPKLGIGYFVEIGPKGNASNVRVQEQPQNSWPSAPLAHEILIGSEWVRLNSHVTIEYGLRTGVLQLEYFDVGGLMWGEYFEPAAAQLGEVSCRVASPAPLPPIDWENDRDYVPGQSH
jgi:hypothetical protein